MIDFWDGSIRDSCDLAPGYSVVSLSQQYCCISGLMVYRHLTFLFHELFYSREHAGRKQLFRNCTDIKEVLVRSLRENPCTATSFK